MVGGISNLLYPLETVRSATKFPMRRRGPSVGTDRATTNSVYFRRFSRREKQNSEQRTNSQPLSTLVGLHRHNIDDVQHIIRRFYGSHNLYISPLILPRLFLIV